jgi:hypothetical protein
LMHRFGTKDHNNAGEARQGDRDLRCNAESFACLHDRHAASAAMNVATSICEELAISLPSFFRSRKLNVNE